MSKRFKSQDYFRYPRLRTKWRRPKGRQSKLRKKKGGSGMMVSIGYGTNSSEKNKIKGMQFSVVSSLKDLENAKDTVIISSTLGAKKTKIIAMKAKEMNLKVLNMKKVKKAQRTEKEIEKRKQEKKQKEKAKKEVEKKEAEKRKEEKKSAMELAEKKEAGEKRVESTVDVANIPDSKKETQIDQNKEGSE